VTIHTHTSSRILLLVSPLIKTFIQIVVATTTVGKPAENTKYTGGVSLISLYSAGENKCKGVF